MDVKKDGRRSRVVVAALLDFLSPVVGEDYLRLAIGRVLCARLGKSVSE